jgi:hypothetical protein
MNHNMTPFSTLYRLYRLADTGAGASHSFALRVTKKRCRL